MKKLILIALASAVFGVGAASAEIKKEDVFKGKLFAPEIILEQREALDLTKQQFAEIRAAVVEVQSGIAEHEWDMREAYQALMVELDRSPIDEAAVLKHADKALLAENQVKKKQITMLIRLKNLLSTKQIDHLESLVAE